MTAVLLRSTKPAALHSANQIEILSVNKGILCHHLAMELFLIIQV